MKFKIDKFKINKNDVFVFLFPVILVLIFLLTDPSRFALDLKDLDLIRMFTSSFVHWNLGHLIRNVIPYYVFILPGWYLAKSSEMERDFYVSFLGILILVPFITRFMHIYTGQFLFGATAGFSGTVLGFSALTVISFLVFLREKFKFKLNSFDLLASFLVFICLPVFIYNFGSLEPLLWVLFALSVLWMLYRFKKEGIGSKIGSKIKEYRKIAAASKLITFTGFLILFLAFYIGFFPPSFVEAEINIFSHLSGFVGGFVVGFVVYFLRVEEDVVPK